MTGESCTGEWPRENGISGSTGRNNKFNKRITGEYDKELLQE